ncbi:hypothetical protein ABK905_01645 [Acerihabitans sp. KWT182]|uniref:Uncharacterized protein n=1 Tax=Acerihabitans sp. KWT182 TaxID=3157919 RepID=A0AAU7QAS8_9GAMM
MLASVFKTQRSNQGELTHPIGTGTFPSSNAVNKTNVSNISNVSDNFASSLQTTGKAELYSYGVGNDYNKIDMDNLSTFVIQTIRNEFKNKADNKHYGNIDDVISPNKLPFYSQKNKEYRRELQWEVNAIISKDEPYNNSFKYTGNPESLFHYGRLLIENRKLAIVNCASQSQIAYFLLAYTFIHTPIEFFIDCVSLKNKKHPTAFSHVIIIIRDAAYKKEAYPDNMNKCYPNDYIIDPWAKISCSARRYSEQWDKKNDQMGRQEITDR